MIRLGDVDVRLEPDLDRELADLVEPFWEEKLQPTAQLEATRGAPVRSGELRDKTFALVEGIDGKPVLLIGSTAPHFLFVEYGTEDTEPQPFARRAANATLARHLRS